MGDTEQDDEPESKWTVKRNHPYSRLRKSQTHLFLCLPPELRNLIWEWVTLRNCRSLRAVCALFKWDMEEVHGLSLVIKDKAEYFANGIRQLLQSLIVRRLKLLYIGTAVPYAEIRLRNPFMLHRLALLLQNTDFSDPDKAENLTRILNSFSRLKILEVTVWMETISKTNFAIFSETCKCLATKPHLKDFRLRGSGLYKLCGRGFQVMPDPSYAPGFRFPMKLSKLKLVLPIISRRNVLAWKAFLGSQDELIEVSLHVGLVSWHFFESALRRSAGSLRVVSLLLCAPETRVFQDADLSLRITGCWISYIRDEVGDVSEHPTPFDWSILSGTRLDSLSVIRSKYPEVSLAIRSQNFSRLRLATLTKLHLISVHLFPEDLTRVLVEAVNVATLYVCNWTLIAEQGNRDFCLVQNIRICILLSMILQTRTMPYLMLVDRSLGNFQPSIVSAVRESASNHRIHIQVCNSTKVFPQLVVPYRTGVIWASLRASSYLVGDDGDFEENVSNHVISNHFVLQ